MRAAKRGYAKRKVAGASAFDPRLIMVAGDRKKNTNRPTFTTCNRYPTF
jgi:hypothetical protein